MSFYLHALRFSLRTVGPMGTTWLGLLACARIEQNDPKGQGPG